MILFYIGKANVMTNAFSRKSAGSLAHTVEAKRPTMREF